MSNAKEEPLKFTTVPTWQAMMSPMAARESDDTAFESRAIAADAQPDLDTTTWPEDTTRLFDVRIRRAPIVSSRADPKDWVQRYEGKEILLESWYGPTASLAMWLSPEARYPTIAYPIRSRPAMHDVSESVEAAAGSEMHLKSYRITTSDQPVEYHLVGYWLVRENIWLMVSARGKSRTDQEGLLAMIRTAKFPPRSSALPLR